MNNFDNLTVGKKIAVIRCVTGLNQTEFANRIGVHILDVHKFENSRKTPTQENIEKIESEFGVKVDAIRLVVK